MIRSSIRFRAAERFPSLLYGWETSVVMVQRLFPASIKSNRTYMGWLSA
jgi:hypothetical protein